MNFFQRSRRTLFRLLAAIVATIAAGAAFRFGCMPLIESVLLPPEDALAWLRRAGTLVAALLGYAAHVRWLERRPVSEFALRPRAILLSTAAGALLVSLTTGTLFALGYYSVEDVRGVDGALTLAGIIWPVAMAEELVFRAILFRIIEEHFGTWAALVLQSLIFAALHLLNIEGDSLTMTLTLIGTLTVGTMWTALYVATRNVWICGANHGAWNFAIVLTGLPLSGLEEWRGDVPLQSSYQGPVWLTGGAYGPEASVICILSTLLATTALLAWSRGKSRLC